MYLLMPGKNCYPKNEDFNGASQMVSAGLSITSTGKDAVLPEPICTPASSRSNLKVEINAEVEKILIEDKIAKGVVYHQNGTRNEVHAKEVILSGGLQQPKSIDALALVMRRS
jgi:choline dehydrogenase